MRGDWPRLLLLLATLPGCAARSAGEAAGPDAPAGKAAADLARSQKLAQALQAGFVPMKPVESTMKVTFPVDAARAGVPGSAIIAFVVLPNGRVERGTRTVVHLEGHPIYAKHVCDALLAARFEPVPADPPGRVGFFSVSFHLNRASDSLRNRSPDYTQRLVRILGELDFDGALTWFQLRPGCSAIKIGIDHYYGPPPT